MRIHEYNTPDVRNIADLTAALADINRLRILNLLLQAKELCVCDIERVLAVPQARVSRHLTILRNSGWVAARRDGRWMHYRLTDDTPMKRDLARAFRKHWAGTPEFIRDVERLRQPFVACCEPVTESLS
jgi:ArsR family transcriptional regulator